ncbi:MAG TPA: DUF6309 family protein [Vicinamibacterales bacterium]|nr:DUF6309 family protein [Vicinamibacterales bacterium]
MGVIAQLTDLPAVRARLLAERGDRTGSLRWTLEHLDAADRQFGGAWREITLDGACALRIILPAHAGEPCRGDVMPLVPREGATVREAAERLRTIESEYEAANPSCWGRIKRAADEPFSTVIVTAAPLDVEEYAGVEPRPESVYRLDGFHRLIGWAWAGRLTEAASIRAFIAVGRIDL